jgi:hypothetical protein
MEVAVDLETLVAQVWNPDVRPLAEEAWRCYNAGAIRASIAATWSAVSAGHHREVDSPGRRG